MRKEPCFDTDLTDFEGEIWRDVKGFDGFYSISNFGRVRAEARYVRTGRGGERLSKQRIMKQQVKMRHGLYNGWMGVIFSVNNEVYTQKVHQLVGRAFCRALKKGEMYYRIDGDSKNNRAENIGITTSDQSFKMAKSREGKSKNYDQGIPSSVIDLSAKTGISIKKILKHNLTSMP
jgi:hypothetical protein